MLLILPPRLVAPLSKNLLCKNTFVFMGKKINTCGSDKIIYIAIDGVCYCFDAAFLCILEKPPEGAAGEVQEAAPPRGKKKDLKCGTNEAFVYS